MTGQVIHPSCRLSSALFHFRHLLRGAALFLLILCSRMALAQSPDRIPYQAVIRSSTGAVLTDQSVGVRISILRGSSSGTAVYSETHAGKTNAYGQLTLEIGAGTVVSGGLSGIDWSQGPFHIRMETDPAGGTNYQIVGSTQLLSVPFSLFAKSASLRYSQTGDTLFSGTQYVIVPGLSASNSNAQGTGLPTLTTTAATGVAETSATLGGNITAQGNAAVSTRGICYALTGSPTTANFTATSGSGIGSFQINLTGLNSGTTYYARAFAINSSGTSYGNQVMFSTTGPFAGDCSGKIKDIDGNEYSIVKIGNQCWMQENLRVTKFRNGILIPLDTSGGVSGDGTMQSWNPLGTPARTVYNHNAANLTTYGFLYNKWAALDNGGICPTGWHLPTPSDWITLGNYLGGELIAGGKMKTTGTSLWNSPNTGADNSSGFSALPAGGRYFAKFIAKGEAAFFWSNSGGGDFSREIRFDSNVLRNPTTISYGNHESHGLSIRCVRD